MEEYHNHKTYSFTKTDHLSFSISHESNNQNYKPPSDSYPVHVQQNKFTINVNSQLERPSKLHPTSFTYYCNHLQLLKQQLLKHVFTEYPDGLATIIQEGTPVVLKKVNYAFTNYYFLWHTHVFYRNISNLYLLPLLVMKYFTKIAFYFTILIILQEYFVKIYSIFALVPLL